MYILLVCIPLGLTAGTVHIGKSQQVTTIKQGLAAAKDGDTVYVHEGVYAEGNIIINKALIIIGIGYPVIDGQRKTEVISVRSSNVTINGLKVIRSGIATLDDPCGIKVYDSRHVKIINNILDDNFFGIYLQNSSRCIIQNNQLKAYATGEHEIGNGIHCFKSDTIQIIGNTVTGHRDGIYFEFVNASIIWNNVSKDNIRYGLHFMFSHNDIYVNNTFDNNGAGVAVMFSKKVSMLNNRFVNNWGDASFGLMLKELSDGYISGNTFENNTSGIFMEGASRLIVEKNIIKDNGWGMKIQASCMDNIITRNNYISNTFDISTNGSLVLNTFENNYWDKYEGYDLNRDGVGDVPFHPLSLFSVIVEKNPPAMILFRSFMVTLLDKSEKLIPSLTPDNFVDSKPLMKSLAI
ncbi:MAG: nitrous oxide reductase family maturation protein NosD [Niabella sp.]